MFRFLSWEVLPALFYAILGGGCFEKPLAQIETAETKSVAKVIFKAAGLQLARTAEREYAICRNIASTIEKAQL